jgi:uncharacterized membrane protein YjfL (UPF0719 family)
MDMYFNLTSVLSALLFVVLGLVIYLVALRTFLPALVAIVRKEIVEGQNTALAILLGLVAIGASIIIAAAVH